MNIIFLDIDGVLNCQEFYTRRQKSELGTYPLCEIDPWRIELLNDLCKKVDAKIVISSTWRMGRTTEELQNIFREVGFTGEIIDCTPFYSHSESVRGDEIRGWIKDNEKLLDVENYWDFHTYVIIDDDSDMLLWQQRHFFQTDNYSGLTPNTCYKIENFFKRTKNHDKAGDTGYRFVGD